MIEASRTIAQEVQLSVAPVFLLTAIAAFLTVLTNRMVRVVDRICEVNSSNIRAKDMDAYTRIAGRLKLKLKLLQRAILCVVFVAILVCLVVVCIFIGDYLAPDLSPIIAALFILAMLFMAIGFALFLVETLMTVETELLQPWA